MSRDIQMNNTLKKIYIFFQFIFGLIGSCRTRSFSTVAVSRGYFLIVVCGLLVMEASLFADHVLQSADLLTSVVADHSL